MPIAEFNPEFTIPKKINSQHQFSKAAGLHSLDTFNHNSYLIHCLHYDSLPACTCSRLTTNPLVDTEPVPLNVDDIGEDATLALWTLGKHAFPTQFLDLGDSLDDISARVGMTRIYVHTSSTSFTR
jgi:hypothetical protein